MKESFVYVIVEGSKTVDGQAIFFRERPVYAVMNHSYAVAIKKFLNVSFNGCYDIKKVDLLHAFDIDTKEQNADELAKEIAEEITQNFIEQILFLVDDEGMTLKEYADRLNISLEELSVILKSKNLSFLEMNKLANALGYEVSAPKLGKRL